MVRGVELAKRFGKREECVRRQRLIGEKQHQMLEEQRIEAIEQRRAARPAQVDTCNQRANGWGQTVDAERRLGHACFPSATGFTKRPHDERTAAGSSIAHPRTTMLPGRIHAITTPTTLDSSATPSGDAPKARRSTPRSVSKAEGGIHGIEQRHRRGSRLCRR